MIQFKSINADRNIYSWEYENAEKLEKAWDINMNVPENDDHIFDVVIDGEKKDFPEDDMWFEDLLTFFGIEIWA